MQSLFFWKEWPKDYRWLWFILSATFIFSFIFLWFSYFQGANGIIDWEKNQEQKVIETTVHNFRLGPFTLTVPGESYAIFEYLQGGDIHHNTTASIIFLVVLMMCVVILLSIITTLERFWFFAGMGIFVIFVAGLRIDVLLLFGIRGIIVPGAVMVLYVATGFYFKSLRPSTSFVIRGLTFAMLTVIIAVLIAFFSQAEYPFIHLVVTAYIPGLIISVLFIVMVAHEILVSFIYITNQGTGNGLKHFFFISLIYIIYVLITALHETGYIQWDFIYINIYLLLSLSAVLGIWGFKIREPQYENIFSFSPFGAYFFIALGSICLVTIGQLLGNANDAALRVVKDITIFSHAGFGIIFLTYFFSNFMAMMAQNMNVYRILYRPNRMPYFTFRFAGLIATLAFIFASGWREYYYHSVAGFYNYVADLYILQGDETYGRAFYEQSAGRAFQNHRANYALATLKASRLDVEKAALNYERANGKRPTEFSLTNTGNLHLWTRAYFDAINTYRAGIEIFPNSPALLNNLGYTYGKIHSLDSASYYIAQAREHSLTRSSAEANFLALAGAEYLPINTDSVLRIFETNSAAVESNALALATLFDQPLEIRQDPLLQNELDLYSATLLNNYIIRNSRQIDTAFVRKAYNIASDPVNFTFSEALKASLANAYYHQGKVYNALAIMGELAYVTQSYKGKYNYIMGLWTLEQGNPEIASSYFSFAELANYKHAKFYKAISLTEAGAVQEAVTAWDTVAQSSDEAEQYLARQLKNILSVTAGKAPALGDSEKYQYCRYRLGVSDTIQFSRLVNTFENVNYKAQALLDMSRRQYKADRLISAIQYLNRISGLELTDKRLYDDVRYHELLMLASRKEIKNLADQINKDVAFDASHLLDKTLYTALISEASGDIEKAKANFEFLGHANPYFEDGILAASTFFRNRDTTSGKPYDILAEAIQINTQSIRLLKAYVAEASRMGFDEFAASAAQRLNTLEASIR